MRVPFYDHASEYAELRAGIDAAVLRVLERGQYEQGHEVEAFEREFAVHLQVPHVVSTGSCHDALCRGIQALGIGAGHEIITAANTDIACSAAIRRAGAHVVFADIDETTHNLNPDDVVSRVTPRTRAILAIHMYGHPADIDSLRRISNAHEFYLIEDAALAVGAAIGNHAAGTLGDLGCFSFAPSKVLSTCGDGGAVATHDAEIAERVRRQFIYWQRPDTSHTDDCAHWGQGDRWTQEGVHSRLVEIPAAMLRVKLPIIRSWVARRQQIADQYSERLSALGVDVPTCVGDVTHTYRNYVVRVPDRDRVRAALAARGVETGLHYTPPLHLQPIYAELGYKEGDLPVTERVAKQLLALPIYPHLSQSQVDSVCQAMAEALS